MEALRRAGAKDLEMVPLRETGEEDPFPKWVMIVIGAVLVVVLVGVIPLVLIYA